MRGIDEEGYYYAYRQNGTRYYYKKRLNTRVKAPNERKPKQKKKEQEGGAPRPPPREYVEYVPAKPTTPIEAIFNGMPPEVQKLINLWLLVLGFANINCITPELIQKAFRAQSMIHHPDKGGSESKMKELAAVRDHLVTLYTLSKA